MMEDLMNKHGEWKVGDEEHRRAVVWLKGALNLIGIFPDKSGHFHIVNAVLLGLEESPYDKQQKIYEKVAKLHERTQESVGRNVRNAIRYAHNTGNLHKANELFNTVLVDDDNYPTATSLILLLTQHLRMHLEGC
ncbi:MAG: sporulation initiation factor Spo0A C-terminal domain-containing protein [Clostridiales bacterium]|jgi:hypothetical protein|nr:sporulation initiation factor Spo0A C-terminal domain-containing protein [Clostridiales bacterium]